MSVGPCCRRSARLNYLFAMAGDWFCSATCSGIHAALRGHVKAGVRPLPGEHSWQIMRVSSLSHWLQRPPASCECCYTSAWPLETLPSAPALCCRRNGLMVARTAAAGQGRHARHDVGAQGGARPAERVVRPHHRRHHWPRHAGHDGHGAGGGPLGLHRHALRAAAPQGTFHRAACLDDHCDSMHSDY